MKNLFNKNKIAIISMVFFAILIFIIPVYTHAQQGGKDNTEGKVTIVERIALSGINNAAAAIGNALLSLTSWLLSISGYFLNQAITLTLNIGDYTKDTNMPVIGETWKTVRNISNIFIIFFLIYSSISIIIGSGVETTKKLIFNIIIAGMLINFSLFFVRVGIDASNLVSMQFYRAMVPNVNANAGIVASATNGGLSDVFMSSLKIPQIYKNTSVLQSADAGLAIFIATISGVIMMITAAFSFFAAGIAIFARTGILLFLMALSPFYFVGMIFPQIEQEVSKRLKDMFTSQLLFLPVYLCLMYIALRLISSPNFNSIFNSGANSNGVIPPGEGPFGVTSIGVTIQYIIAIIFINAPLIAALKFGAVGAKWAPGLDMATGLLGNISGFVGRKTVGKAAGAVGKRFDNMAINAQKSPVGKAATNVLRGLGISQAVRGGINTAAKGKYGGSKSTEDYDKENKERAKTLAGISRTATNSKNLKTYLDALKTGGGVSPVILKSFKDSVSGMDNKELEKLPFDTLSNEDFITHLSSSKFESLIKSDELTPDQKSKIKNARTDGFKKIVTNNGNSGDYLINTHLKGRPEDVSKLPEDILRQRDVAKYLDPAMLKAIANANVDKTVREDIRNIIDSYIFPTKGSVIEKSQNYLKTNIVF